MLRNRSLSSTSVDSEDLPYQMAEYVLLTPKSPASPAIRDGRLMADLFVTHTTNMAAAHAAAGNNTKVTMRCVHSFKPSPALPHVTDPLCPCSVHIMQ